MLGLWRPGRPPLQRSLCQQVDGAVRRAPHVARRHRTTRTCAHATPPRRLSLLNTTVAQLAKYVNQALTIAYRDIYGDGDGDQPVTLQLLTSPLAATEEVVNLYAAGLVPIEIAVPAVLNAIGATRDQIAKATEEAAKEAEEKKRCECEDREIANADAKLGQEERKQQIELNKAKQSTEAAQEAANVEKTKADTKKTLEEAKVAGKPKPAASSGGSSSAKK